MTQKRLLAVLALGFLIPVGVRAQDKGSNQPPPYPVASQGTAPANQAPPANPYAYPGTPQNPYAYPGAQPSQNPYQAAPAPNAYPPPGTYPGPQTAFPPQQKALAEGPGKAYAAVKLGVISPQAKDLTGYSNGFAIEGALGYRVHENLALEVSVGRFSISGKASGVVSGVYATATDDVVGYPVLASLKLFLPIDRMELFVVAGGGIYFMSSNVEVTAPGYYPYNTSDSDSPFAMHFGGGINVRLSPAAVLGVEIKYVLGDDHLYDARSSFDSVIIGGHLTYHFQ